MHERKGTAPKKEMKNIKIFVILAATLAVLASCDKRDFTVKTGNTPVEFVPSDSIEITGEYYYLPIQMTQQMENGYECRGTTRAAAKSLKDCKPTKSRRVQELISYDGKKWQY